jgi:hypothetical protein
MNWHVFEHVRKNNVRVFSFSLRGEHSLYTIYVGTYVCRRMEFRRGDEKNSDSIDSSFLFSCLHMYICMYLVHSFSAIRSRREAWFFYWHFDRRCLCMIWIDSWFYVDDCTMYLHRHLKKKSQFSIIWRVPRQFPELRLFPELTQFPERIFPRIPNFSPNDIRPNLPNLTRGPSGLGSSPNACGGLSGPGLPDGPLI